jgi:hypothetical protein
MIEIVMMVALGFLLGCLVALLFARPFWSRAVRLTKRRIEQTMPMSIAEIRAEKDHLRAQFAIEVQRLEAAATRANDKAVNQLIVANKRRAAIGALERELAALKRRSVEMTNANAALTETVDRRLPHLEDQILRAQEEIAAKESELGGFRIDYAEQTRSLSAAREEARRQADEIERLRLALDTAPGAKDADDPRRLQAELSRLREELHRRKQIDAQENAELLEHIQKLGEQIMAQAARPHTAEIMSLPKPALEIVEPDAPRLDEDRAGEKARSLAGRVRALRRAAGGQRSLKERLAAEEADAD